MEQLKDGQSGKAIGIRENKIINVELDQVNFDMKDVQENYRIAEISY